MLTLYTLSIPIDGERMVLTALLPIEFLIQYRWQIGSTFIVLNTLPIGDANAAQTNDLRTMVGVELFKV